MNGWKPTTWQRSVCIAMYLVACRSQHPLEVWFTRRALEYLMWFDWHGWHTAKMQELAVRGWLEISRNESGMVIYRMTPATHGQLSADMAAAIANSHFAPEQDKLF